jgi:hypothetical protein
MRVVSRTILAVLLACLFGLACNSNKYDGKWHGTTSQGKEISFTVNGGVVTTSRLEFELKCERPGFCPAGGSVEQDLGAKISGASFSASLERADLTGKFDSATSAAGELKAEQTNPQCGRCTANATWTAKKL